MFHFPSFPPHTLYIQVQVTTHNKQRGFPIRKSSDHTPVIGSPRLIADSHVLHRLLVPRHPPCALNNLATQIITINTQQSQSTLTPHPQGVQHSRRPRCSRPLYSSQTTTHTTTTNTPQQVRQPRQPGNPHQPTRNTCKPMGRLVASKPNSMLCSPGPQPPTTRSAGDPPLLVFHP